MTPRLFHGDCLDVLVTLEPDSLDACVTDPPYGLAFMGKEWDNFAAGDIAMRRNPQMDAVNAGMSRQGGRQRASADYQKRQARDMRAYQQWTQEWSAQVYRVLKPGAHLLAFGGTRTYHRLACAIEDAGFEMRDCLMWIYGSGFPKSLDVAQAIDRSNGKVRGRVPHPRGKGFGLGVAQTYAADVWTTENAGTRSERTPITEQAKNWQGWGTALKPAYEPILLARKPLAGTVAATVQQYGTGALNIEGCRVALREEEVKTGGFGNGAVGFHGGNARGVVWQQRREGRWPANVLHDGSDEVLAGFPHVAGAVSFSRPKSYDASSYRVGNAPLVPGYGDTGSAARFFYCAKASRSEREAGLEAADARRESDRVRDDGVGGDNPRNRTNTPRKNHHPTVKPLALMRYLVRLVTPPGGTVLDPFAGSGTTLMAADAEGFDAIGIEREAAYVEIAQGRLSAQNDKPLLREVSA